MVWPERLHSEPSRIPESHHGRPDQARWKGRTEKIIRVHIAGSLPCLRLRLRFGPGCVHGRFAGNLA
jgi:hypothetical protein